jgi:hypothetical protein
MSAQKVEWSDAFYELEGAIHDLVLMSELACDNAPDDDDLALFTARNANNMAVALEKKWRVLHKTVVASDRDTEKPTGGKPKLSVVPNN